MRVVCGYFYNASIVMPHMSANLYRSWSPHNTTSLNEPTEDTEAPTSKNGVSLYVCKRSEERNSNEKSVWWDDETTCLLYNHNIYNLMMIAKE